MCFIFGNAEQNYDIVMPIGVDNESWSWKWNSSKNIAEQREILKR